MSTRASDTSLEGQRPLSPHLQIWRWHATMATSIFHRASGVGNYIGAIGLTLFLIVLSGGPEAYGSIAFLFEGALGWVTRIVMFLLTLSYSYHWLNGLRHLIWDAGAGFDPKVANRVSWLVMIGTPVPAIVIWVLALGVAS